MPLKKLRQFAPFNFPSFSEKKDLRCVASQPWIDFDSKAKLGTKYTLIILQDATEYGNKDITNAGQIFDVKIPSEAKTFKPLAKVRLIDPTATIYGDFQNQLSVKAANIEFLGQA